MAVLIVDVSSVLGHFISGTLKVSSDFNFIKNNSIIRTLAYSQSVAKDYNCSQIWLVFEGATCAFPKKISVNIKKTNTIIKPNPLLIKRVPKFIYECSQILLSEIRKEGYFVDRYIFMSADDIISRLLKDSSYDHAYILSKDKDMKKYLRENNTFLKVRNKSLGILEYPARKK